MPVKTKPLRYQVKGVRKIHHFKGKALLADEMGLGKTFQMLHYVDDIQEFPVVVVCPAAIKWNWENEIKTHLGLRCHVLESRKVPKRFKLRHKILVINYEILGDWLPTLKKMKPKVILIDECQRIANPSTKQTKNVKRLCKRVKRIILASGTPQLNRPSELFTGLNILRPDVFSSRKDYEERYCCRTRTPWGFQAKGAANMAELNRRLNTYCMIRRTKRQVMKDLPEKLRIVVPLDIENRKEYEAAEKDFIGWITKKSASLAKKAKKAERLVRGGYLARLAARLKLLAVIKWIDDFMENSDEKLLVFGIHKPIMKALHAHYKEISVLVDGETTGRKRQVAFDRFNTKAKCRLCFGNIYAAGVGWSCKSTSVTAHVEMAWRPGDHTQAEDRVHGMGRGVKGVGVRAYYLIAKNTIEELLCKIIQKKQHVSDQVLDGKIRDDGLDVFTQLENALAKKAKLKIDVKQRRKAA